MSRRLIRHIRRQPRATRESYAFFGALLVAGFVLLVWIMQVPATITALESVQFENEPPGPTEQTVTTSRNPLPFSSFFRRLQASLGNLSDDLFNEDTPESPAANTSTDPQTNPPPPVTEPVPEPTQSETREEPQRAATTSTSDNFEAETATATGTSDTP